MSKQQALLDCTFSWGKICHLYHDSIEIAGRSYSLDDLTYIHPTYRTLFGITSARLELCFGLRRLILRGIPDPEIARQMVSHLSPYTEQAGPHTILHHARSGTTQTRDLARAQAKTWERSQKMPEHRDAQSHNTSITLTSETGQATPVAQPISLSEVVDVFDDCSDFAEQPAATEDQLPLPTQPSTPMLMETPSAQPIKQLPMGSPVSSVRPRPATKSRPVQVPRREPPLRSVQLVNALTSLEQTLARVSDAQAETRHMLRFEQTFTRVPLAQANKKLPEKKNLATGSVPISGRKSSVLPVIHVPVRLQPGECAHYSIGAALCSDNLTSSEYAAHFPLDQGLLILTNRRVFYLGKRCQLVLAYTHLWYVSLLQNAVALHIEGQFRRIIMEIEHPQEWASRIEQLAFIARRSPSRSVQPVPTFVLPGVKPTAALPTRREMPKAPTIHTDAAAQTANTPSPNIPIVEIVPHMHHSIFEAKTIPFDWQIEQPEVEMLTTHEAIPLVEQDTIKIATLTLPPHNKMEEATYKPAMLSTIVHSEQEHLPTDTLASRDSDDEATDKMVIVPQTKK